MDIVPKACDACGNRESKLHSRPVDYISGERFTVVRCRACGLAFVDPQPAATGITRYYPSRHQVAEPAGYERSDARSRVRFVQSLYGTTCGSILDVGCGKGLLLSGLQKLGWEVRGSELSEASGRYARSLGLTITGAEIEDMAFESNAFDLITLFHVLEHLPRPRQALERLHQFLRPDGQLVVEVPNFGSWYARFFGDDWFHYDVPRHLFHFDVRTLSGMLGRAGYHVVAKHTSNVKYDAFGAVQSTLNRLLPYPNLLNNFNTRQTNFQDLWQSEHRFGSIGALLVSDVLLAIGYPSFAAFGAFASPWVEGGTLRFVCHKAGA